jgi:hypothetical protein
MDETESDDTATFVTTTHTIFSKDKGVYTADGAEDFLTIATLSSGRVGMELYTGQTAHFGGNCKSSADAIAYNNWYHIALTAEFDGTDTVVKIYVDGTMVLDFTAAELFIKDKSSYPNAWLMIETDDTTVAANAWHGFLYHFAYTTSVMTAEQIGAEIHTSACTGGDCSACPTVNGNICLWMNARG